MVGNYQWMDAARFSKGHSLRIYWSRHLKCCLFSTSTSTWSVPSDLESFSQTAAVGVLPWQWETARQSVMPTSPSRYLQCQSLTGKQETEGVYWWPMCRSAGAYQGIMVHWHYLTTVCADGTWASSSWVENRETVNYTLSGKVSTRWRRVVMTYTQPRPDPGPTCMVPGSTANITPG